MREEIQGAETEIPRAIPSAHENELVPVKKEPICANGHDMVFHTGTLRVITFICQRCNNHKHLVQNALIVKKFKMNEPRT